jgi:hypothetical protein
LIPYCSNDVDANSPAILTDMEFEPERLDSSLVFFSVYCTELSSGAQRIFA